MRQSYRKSATLRFFQVFESFRWMGWRFPVEDAKALTDILSGIYRLSSGRSTGICPIAALPTIQDSIDCSLHVCLVSGFSLLNHCTRKSIAAL
jgi:hypothetical protein